MRVTIWKTFEPFDQFFRSMKKIFNYFLFQIKFKIIKVMQVITVYDLPWVVKPSFNRKVIRWQLMYLENKNMKPHLAVFLHILVSLLNFAIEFLIEKTQIFTNNWIILVYGLRAPNWQIVTIWKLRNPSIWLVDPFQIWPTKSAYSAIQGFDWVLVSHVVCIIQIVTIINWGPLIHI